MARRHNMRGLGFSPDEHLENAYDQGDVAIGTFEDAQRAADDDACAFAVDRHFAAESARRQSVMHALHSDPDEFSGLMKKMLQARNKSSKIISKKCLVKPPRRKKA